MKIKKNIVALLLTVLSIGFGSGLIACTNNIGESRSLPSKENVIKTFKDAELAYSWFSGFNQINIDPNRTEFLNGYVYYLVDHKGITAREDLYNYLCSFFTRELAQELIDQKVFDNYLFSEINGKLYVFGGHVGLYPYDMVDTCLDIKYISDDMIIVSASISWNDNGTTHSCNYDYHYEKNHSGEWRFTNFQLPAKLCIDSVNTPQDKIISAYNKAAEAFDWFDVESLPVSNESVKKDGIWYNKVVNTSFKKLSDFETYLKTIFSDDIVDTLLYSQTPNPYVDIDGKLYAIARARGRNLMKIDETVSVKKESLSKYVVTSTVYVYGREEIGLTIGTVNYPFDYECIDGKWIFTSFGPRDYFDETTKGVYVFKYDFRSLEEVYNYDDLSLCYYLIGSDGAYTEGPLNELGFRLLERPSQIISTIAGLYCDWNQQITKLLGSSFAYWYNQEDTARFETLLTDYNPRNDAEASVIEDLKTTYYSIVETISDE